jgi:polysaccharide export outer membrane protein
MKAHSSPAFVFLALLIFSLFPAAAQVSSDPVLKVNDTIRIEVYNEPELNTTAKILKSGEVVLQFIGPVKVAGLTVSKANETIHALYAKDYLVDPKLTVTVAAYSEDFISVIGAVASPGQFALPASGKLDLAAALAMAGGATADADPAGVTVTRIGGKTSTHPLASIQGGTPVALLPGDRVFVKRSAFHGKVAYIFGEVRRTGPVAFPASGKLDLIEAIAQAGSYTELGDAKKVRVNRNGQVTTINLKEMTEKGNQRYFLLPEDIVTVPARWY